MEEPNYYDGTKLLSLTDINGNKPEIYISTSNRSAGKTTYFNHLAIKRFFEKHQKFCLLYRYKYELSEVGDKFFKDVADIWYPDWFMRSEPCAKGIYHNLYIAKKEFAEDKDCGAHCGYAIALNCADQIKKYSHLLSDCSLIIFDEFQSETNDYCAREVDKFRSIHVSLARGHGKQSKYLPVIMISNPVSLLNPYYVAMGISTRLSKQTKFMRGKGFVIEQGFNESASKAQQHSGFNQAFEDDTYSAYASQGVYLNDSKTFIEKVEGNSKYLATLKYMNKYYAVRSYPELGIIYCDNRPDMTNPNRLAVTTEDHQINYVMLQSNGMFISQLRFYFDKGCLRFKDYSCKEAMLKALSY